MTGVSNFVKEFIIYCMYCSFITFSMHQKPVEFVWGLLYYESIWTQRLYSNVYLINEKFLDKFTLTSFSYLGRGWCDTTCRSWSFVFGHLLSLTTLLNYLKTVYLNKLVPPPSTLHVPLELYTEIVIIYFVDLLLQFYCTINR